MTLARALKFLVPTCFPALLLSGLAFAAGPLFDPPAIDVSPDHDRIGKSYPIRKAVQDGQRLFEAKFNALDGAGRPHATAHGFPTQRTEAGPAMHRVAGPDANSCMGCHNQPTVGGSGDFVTNVFVAAPQYARPSMDSISDVFSNERNTKSLFGLGAVELLAREMSRDLLKQREQATQAAKTSGREVTQPLSSKGVPFGRIIAQPDGEVDDSGIEGVSPDLMIKPFGSKGTVTSLREFSILALNQHHGIEPVEFFGQARTGTKDFDQDGVEDEFSLGQVSAITLFQAALPAPDNRRYAQHAGFALFKQAQCTACHIPELKLGSNVFSEPGPFNRIGVLANDGKSHVIKMSLPLEKRAGGYLVNAFTDLKRHVMCDNQRKQLCNEVKKQDKVPLNMFLTARLWDLNTSAPYCHRGDCNTLTEAIQAHGGEAAASADAFDAMPNTDKRTLIDFLRYLGAPRQGMAAKAQAVSRR
jgi:cytochrome c peroxidase